MRHSSFFLTFSLIQYPNLVFTQSDSRANVALAGENDSHNKAVETESLAENKNENDTDVDILLGIGAHTSVASDTNAETSSERR